MATGGRKKLPYRRLRPFSAAVIVVAFALNCVMALTCLTPKRYPVAEGKPAEETIYATRTVEDYATTNRMKETARNMVKDVVVVDTEKVDSLLKGLDDFFTAIAGFRKTAQDKKSSTAPTATLADGSVVAVDDSRGWKDILSETEILSLTMALPVPIGDSETGYALLEADETDLALLHSTLKENLRPRLESGVNEDNIDRYGQELTNKVNVTTLPVRLKPMASILINEYLAETQKVDVTATNALRQAAADGIETAYIPRGKAIVQQGETVSADQMETLRLLDLVEGEEKGASFVVGVALYLAFAYGLLLAYLKLNEPAVFGSNKLMTILLLVLLMTIAVQWLSYYMNPAVIPSMLAALLCCVFIGPSVARCVNLTLALALSITAGGSGSTLFSADSLLAMAAVLVSGEVCILVATRSGKRGELIGAGALGGIAGGFVQAAGLLIRGETGTCVITGAGVTMATGLVLAVFCVGMMSMWENMFDVVTNARLHELANTNHPLLKKLMTNAPGTYHHSMMAASLAEGAAEAIGANAPLAKAAAMYHDVGKLRRPLYFTENQNGRKIHDTLPPEESAGYIISHVKDADPLLAKYHVPGAIRQIAGEHHGTTLVSYFYYKAKKQQGEDGQPVIERLFRYPGSLPSTKESGIVMVADSCEAAVRSLGEPTKEQIGEMIHKVIQGKIDDGQFIQCPLTMGEINKIEKSFLVTFGGLLHERIRYPDPVQKERTDRLERPDTDAVSQRTEKPEAAVYTGRIQKTERSSRIEKQAYHPAAGKQEESDD